MKEAGVEYDERLYGFGHVMSVEFGIQYIMGIRYIMRDDRVYIYIGNTIVYTRLLFGYKGLVDLAIVSATSYIWCFEISRMI
jgi:hypothetical protein